MDYFGAEVVFWMEPIPSHSCFKYIIYNMRRFVDMDTSDRSKILRKVFIKMTIRIFYTDFMNWAGAGFDWI